MMTVSDIFDELGGAAAIARATGVPLTTVASWKAANFIPDWRQPTIITLAGKAGKKLRKDDFPPKETRRPRSEQAA